MKRSYYILLFMLIPVIIFYSCKKDIGQTTLTQPTAINGFTASASQVVLSNSNDSTQVVTFKWNTPDYGYAAVVSYTLLFDVPSDTSGTNAWANATKVTVATNTLQKTYLGTDFNTLLNQMGLPFGSTSTIVVRLKADVNQSTGTVSTVPSLYSTIAMTVNPYKIVLVYPKLYVAGDFLSPSWTQIDQPGWILAAPKSDGVYEGYINFPNADNKFKLCTQTSWNGTNYGWGTSATTMSGSGSAGNLYFAGPGYARVVADVNALTISYTSTKWVIAGDFNGWNLTATPMTFNASTNKWTATNVNVTDSTKLKFEGDATWSTELGSDSKGGLTYKGTDIKILKTGSYTITLDLSGGAGNYTYTIK